MADRVPNSKGHKLNRNSAVSISSWDENGSTVQRLRRPYVIQGEEPTAPPDSTTRVQMRAASGQPRARPTSLMSTGSSRPSTQSPTDRPQRPKSITAPSSPVVTSDVPLRPASATGYYTRPTSSQLTGKNTPPPPNFSRPTSLPSQRSNATTPTPSSPSTPIKDEARSAVVEQSRRGYRSGTESHHASTNPQSRSDEKHEKHPRQQPSNQLRPDAVVERRLSVRDAVMGLQELSDDDFDEKMLPARPHYQSGPHDRGRRPSQGALTQREDVLKFEQGRIKALQEERLHIQKKTFTKWVNSFLQKARMEVDDLFVDLADGRKLLKLLEIISGEKLGKPNSGKMRVHKVENLNKSLAFLQTKKVRLESIGAEDVVDGNPRLILGLIWTIILRFQIQEIEIDVDEDNETSEKKSAKDALLLWCQRKTNGYPGVHINDFTGSWRSGLGFNALIHAHRPHLVDYDQLVPSRHIDNLNNAFDVAHAELGIPRLLDAEDVDSPRPDEKSILTYVASYYHTFARMKNEQKSGRRIANIVGQMMDADRKKDQYARLTSALLEWIRLKVIELEDRRFPNSLEGIQKELLRFKQYRTIEKPPKYKERSEIEALFFHINTLLKSLNQPGFQPNDGHLVQDLQRAWETLESAEHRREVALRQELLRQEKLEQLHYKFVRKSVLREGYVKEMIQVLSDPRYGNNMSQVDATVKKHEAISADILARRERFNDLSAMSQELRQENYHGAEKVAAREAEIRCKWEELLELLERHKMSLNVQSSLMGALREIDTLIATIRDLHAQFQSEGVGEHLLAVEDLLQKHALQELQVTAVGDTLSRLRRHGSQFVAAKHKDAPVLQERLDLCDRAYEDLVRSSEERRGRLEDARNLYQFIQDHEEEEAWLIEKQRICTAAIAAKDLRAVLSLQQKHKALMDEIKARRPKSEQLREAGLRLVAEKHPRAAEIRPRIESLQSHWTQLQHLAESRRKQLEDAAEAFQFYTDANEAESWLKEKMALVNSTDYGVDAPSAQALLARHRDLRGEIQAYKGDVTSLNAHASKLMQSGVASLELMTEPEPEVEEWRTETRLVPQEVWEDETYERVENKITYEMRLVPQVKSLYPYTGQGISMVKGEVMVLLSKTNGDWWNIRQENGQEGFVPANYVRDIDPKPMSVPVQRPEKVKDVRKVKKTKMVRQAVKVKKPVTPKRLSVTEENNLNVERRQKNINDTYGELLKLAEKRHLFLEDAIRLYGFYAECDDFEKWINDKEKFLKTDDTAESPEHVDTAKRKYENFLTDLSASSKRIDALDHAVADFQAQGHSQIDKILARQKQIHGMWKHLNWLKAQKEKSLEGASSVQVFHRTCDEARDWMTEKLAQLEGADHGPDLKTVQALQRRHHALERELAPVEEKVKRVNLLAESVKTAYPHEKGRVDTRQTEVQKLWEKVKNQAKQKRDRLEDAVGMQIFMSSSQNLLNWADGVMDTLNTEVAVRDVATAEMLQKNHSELQDDIRAHNDEWKEVVTLGNTLQTRNPDNEVLRERLESLIQAHDSVTHGWLARENWLKQCLDLQMFNREADQLDASSSAHEAVLDVTDLGRSLDEVNALEKRHHDLEKTLAAQDERLMDFNEIADKLLVKQHYDADNIDVRRRQVLARRQAVKDLAEQRRAALEGATNFQEFTAKVEDLRGWVAEKTKIAGDESYRDLNNLERKLQKHEAFERELKANEGQLRAVNKNGASAGEDDTDRVADVARMLAALNSEWDNMSALTREKGRRLRQAAAQREYNRTLDAARAKLDEVKTALTSTQVGDDLRHCKDLLKKHSTLEQDITTWKNKINDLVAEGQNMAQDGHFDAASILRVGKDCQKKFQELDAPAKRRRDMLEESLRFHNFNFELNSELSWVREHKPLAESTAVGANLHQAQALDKKHKKLQAEIDGHQPMINKTLDNGKSLLQQKHPRKDEIENLSQSLETEWSDLKQAAKERARKLDLSLKAQEFFFEAEEVESWLTEKNEGLQSTDHGRDRDAASKLLAKHKALELELDSYNGIVTEMGHVAEKMVSSGHPDGKAISARQQVLQQQMKQLQKLAAARKVRLMESMYRHEYLLASAELEQWIKEQMLTATSEEYGQDFEHLLLIRSKFDDWKLRMEAESERFAQCKELAEKLILAESPYVEDVEKRQEQLGEAWRKLLDQIRSREQRLTAAGEIHRFHRDVADAVARIQEKEAALPEDLGRDLNSVLALIKRHEGFENDLVALEAQLQVLVEDGARLQAQFPGQNAVQIGAQQKMVVDQWAVLQARTADRRDMLNKACDLHKFLSQARDLINWSSGLRSAMKTQEKVRDAGSAQTLKTEHEAIKAEIEAREDNFEKAVALRKQMVEDGHYATDEIEEKLRQLLDERQQLHSAWQHKKIHLDQLIDLHFFMREAKQILTLSATQEAALNTPDADGSVDEVASQVKKHDAFEKLVATQEERVAALNEQGSKLIAQNHFDSPSIQDHLKQVGSRRKRVAELCKQKRQRLHDNLLYAQFVRDVAEAEAWVAERHKRLQSDVSSGEEVASLEDKITKLQKHQAFHAELAAHEPRIAGIKGQLDRLVAQKHANTQAAQTAWTRLSAAWRQLLANADSHGQGLEEAQDILEFHNQVDKIEAWIRDKEMLVQAGETGEDLEHCTQLQRKLDDVDSDMRVDDARIKSINALADKLIRQGRSDTQNVQQKRDRLQSRWQGLQGALQRYREQLSGAHEVHGLTRDVDDTRSRIHEKAVAMSSQDVGRDLLAVQQLQRRQEAVERDMTAIDGKIKEHDGTARVLMKRHPVMSEGISTRLSGLQTDWRQLLDSAEQRRLALLEAHKQHKLSADMKELTEWVNTTVKRMRDMELPSNVADAEAAIKLHAERKAEIDGRSETFDELRGAGTPETAVELDQLKERLESAWLERKESLNQAKKLAMFKDQADEAERWLASKEAFLNNDDLGDSLSAVEVLLQKHEAFEKTLAAQAAKVEELQEAGSQLGSAPGVASRIEKVTARWSRLQDSSAKRRTKLVDTRKLLCFLRNIYEVQGWLHSKIQIANDESYRDPSNLQSKIQKHSAFEAELQANACRVEAVVAEGESLKSQGHFAADEISEQVNEVSKLWSELSEASQQKRQKLADAFEALMFVRSVEELEGWMDEMEAVLSSEDHGRDLASVANLLRRHKALENDMVARGDDVKELKAQVSAFEKADHFMKEDLFERFNAANKRYNSLQKPMEIRRENLEESLLLQQFTRDVEEELQWLEDAEPALSSKDLGSSLTTVQSLQKKHQALEAELIARQPVIDALSARAAQMIRAEHFASQDVDTKMKDLKTHFERNVDLASVRRLRLLDAVESQTFYAEASYASSWMKEKRPGLSSSHAGKDEESVEGLVKRLEAAQRDVLAFGSTVQRLKKLSQGLVDRGHFDNVNIQLKQTELEANYEELQKLAATRQQRLNDSLDLFRFLREADEVSEWIQDQTAVAASEDYGTDVEHVEQLIKKFDAFIASLNSAETRVQACVSRGHVLISANHPESDRIKEKLRETKALWDDIKELAHARQEALAGAKQVHIFDRSADETMEWVEEKAAALSSEGFGQDLETIQALARKHEAFESELAAVRSQVEAVKAEAHRLANAFPDTQDHVEVKCDEVSDVWRSLLGASVQHRERLLQSEQLQSYFDQHRDLMAWLNEMLAKITAPDLAKDVSGAEALIIQHAEHRVELDAREEEFEKFFHDGAKLVKQGHFLAEDVEEKINALSLRKKFVMDTWQARKDLYNQNLDTQMFKRHADLLESWLVSREPILKDSTLGDSIPHAEDLLRKHDDFLTTISAQEDAFEELKRITLLEQSFQKQKEAEKAAKTAERDRLEKEKIEARKRKEVQRITDERRREEERRRLQDGRGYDRPDRAQEAVNGNGTTDPSRLHPPGSPSLQKSGSLTQLIGDRMRREMKRAESMKVDLKKAKRTPSFTTRRRTQSFRKLQKLDNVDLPPVEVNGYLERKQELQSGGKKAPVRSWKTFYTVLCGQLLCFFKDAEDFVNSKAASSPVSILKARVVRAQDYTKRKYVFRLTCTDNSEYLFLSNTEDEMNDWVNKIAFHAQLPPSLQLLSYDDTQKRAVEDRLAISSDSSRASSPEPGSPQSNDISPAPPVQTQTQFLAQHRPPIPPRTAPPPVPTRRTVESVDVRDGPMRQNGAADASANWRHSVDSPNSSVVMSPPPALPASLPPRGYAVSPPYGSLPPPSYQHTGNSREWNDPNQYFNQSYGNLPTPLPRPSSVASASSAELGRRASESSSESELPRNTKDKETSKESKDKRSVFNIFQRKKKGAQV